MPADQGDAERFAAVEEQGRSPRSVADPELAKDLEIAAMLRSRGAAFAPRADERARVRARVMAQLAGDAANAGPAEPTARLLRPAFPAVSDLDPDTMDESAARVTAPLSIVADDPHPGHAGPAARPGRLRRGGRHTLPNRPFARARSGRPPSGARRALLAGAAAVLAIVAVATGGIAASRNALPGDALYGVKRAAESVGNAITMGDEAKAQRRLESATTRLQEMQTLTAREPSSAIDAQVARATMDDFDTAASEGARTILAAQTQQADGAAALARLRAWAADQAAKLAALRASLPASARPGADTSITMLDRMVSRAEAISARMHCTTVTAGSDDLGPLPATGPCTPRPASEGRSGGTTTADTARGGVPAGSPTRPTGEGGPTGGTPTPAEPGLLPSVGGPASVGGGEGPPATEETTTTTAPTPEPSKAGPPPPPLPPIKLPPLLPGGSGITIG